MLHAALDERPRREYDHHMFGTGRVRVIGRIAVVAAALAASRLAYAQERALFTFAPWVGAGVGAGVAGAACGCDFPYGGPTFAGMLGVGLDLTRDLSIGLEKTGQAVILGDSPNVASMQMLVARYLFPLWPGRSALLTLGAGWASYRLGNDALVKNLPALTAGFGVTHMAPHFDAAPVISASASRRSVTRVIDGKTQVRYHFESATAMTNVRVHFADWPE